MDKRSDHGKIRREGRKNDNETEDGSSGVVGEERELHGVSFAHVSILMVSLDILLTSLITTTTADT